MLWDIVLLISKSGEPISPTLGINVSTSVTGVVKILKPNVDRCSWIKIGHFTASVKLDISLRKWDLSCLKNSIATAFKVSEVHELDINAVYPLSRQGILFSNMITASLLPSYLRDVDQCSLLLQRYQLGM